MQINTVQSLKEQLFDLIIKGNAHATFDQSVKNLNTAIAGKRPEKLPYTIWQLIEHIRIVQLDILEFCRNPDHQSPAWPDEYWPSETTPPNKAELESSISQVKQDREAFLNLLDQHDTDLYQPFKHGTGQNLLREALLIADHTAYHTAQIILIRRLLGDWNG